MYSMVTEGTGHISLSIWINCLTKGHAYNFCAKHYCTMFCSKSYCIIFLSKKVGHIHMTVCSPASIVVIRTFSLQYNM